MKLLKKKRVSTLLIFLSSLILCLGLFLAFYISDAADNLKNDARLINEAGIIRGSIQRLSKLVLTDSPQPRQVIYTNINRLLKNFSSVGNNKSIAERNLHQGVVVLETSWRSLEKSLKDYQTNKSTLIREIILEKSEVCWGAANAVVHMAQFVTEEKVKKISKSFYLVLIINVFTAILLILLILFSVRKKLEIHSLRDPMTGLFNRRSYENVIDAEMARVNRYGLPITLILLDVDLFKKVNDVFGHRAGDKVLTELAQLLILRIRKSDSVFRFGGEEFAILCPEKGAEGAHKLAEKIRQTVESHVFESVGNITISLGIAEFDSSISKETLYHRADLAMYRAKHNGRNRTEVFDEAIDSDN